MDGAGQDRWTDAVQPSTVGEGPSAPPGARRGVAYRVAAADWQETFAYLLEREQPTETYVEAWRDLRIDGAAPTPALVFLSDPTHAQWAGALTLERQAELIDGATGLSGRNIDYLRDLVAHLRDEGVQDRAMERLLEMVVAATESRTLFSSSAPSRETGAKRPPARSFGARIDYPALLRLLGEALAATRVRTG
eukprot:gene14331-18971_t